MIAPLYHSAPASYGLQSFLAGELVVIRPRLDPEQLLADIEHHRLTHLYLVPTHYVRLLRLPDAVKQKYDLSSMKFVASTGSPCPPDVKRAMIDWWGPVINEGYASSETGFITICSSEEALARPGTAGRMLPGSEVRILDDDGRELPPFAPGTIYCRNTKYPDFEYVNRPDARREMERDGLNTVGDVGYLDERRLSVSLRPQGRHGDLRRRQHLPGGDRGGLDHHAGRRRLRGVRHTRCRVRRGVGGARAAARRTTALERDAIRAFLRARIADYKVPRVIEFAAELPREESGKIFKRKLREPYWREAGRRI